MILDIITELNKEKHGDKASFASLERELELGNGSIKKWAKHKPSIDTLILIADHFNVSLDYLLEREPKNPDHDLMVAFHNAPWNIQESIRLQLGLGSEKNNADTTGVSA